VAFTSPSKSDNLPINYMENSISEEKEDEKEELEEKLRKEKSRN
jgi:hypothetical protein